MKKKVLSLLLASVMVVSMAACGKDNAGSSDAASSGESQTGSGTGGEDQVGGAVPSYTYHLYDSALAICWNEHAWELNADDTVRRFLTTPFVDISILDSENGVYQWVYEMATSVEDVTAAHQDDLTKYNVSFPEGQDASNTKSGYVYELKLREGACWQDGTPINADTYIYSMKQLLNPDMQNYRANLYYSGESAVAGGNAMYNSGRTAKLENAANANYTMADLVLDANGNYTTPDGGAVYVATGVGISWLGGNSLADYVGAYGEAMFGMEGYNGLAAAADADGYVVLNEKALADLVATITAVADWGETEADASNYLAYDATFPVVNYDDVVGCYKVDDYTIRYVTQNYIDLNNFLTSLTSTWLVYEPLYEAGKDTTGKLVTTNYCTSVDTTMSYGPYKLVALQKDKQMVLEQNENWYGYQKQEDGSLLSMTEFTVDGKSVPQYQTTKIVIDVMDDNAAKQAFLKGQLSEWSPGTDDLIAFATSDRLLKVDETYTMSFFFNTNLDKLKEMDKSKGNTNSVVLSNDNFRKAFSLSIDRSEWVGATPGYKPAYAVMNNLYFYDVYNDPTSSYRGSDEAMQAICNVYGVAYGEGTPYATLKEAYESINGYNLTEAQALMKQACQELVEAGLYKEGDPIYIRIGYKKGALDSADQNQVALMQKYLNKAVEGSGFGTVTLEPIGNIENRYDDTANGEFAIGYGAWGGAAFYPFRNFQVYCDPDQYSLNEAGCWNPATENLTLKVKGEDVTMTWQAWSGALIGNGAYSQADFATKLSITAQMEEAWLKKYYRIPLASETLCTMVGYQLNYYTEEYNIMYDFGGIRLMGYNYNDAEWAEYVNSQGGTLNYE